MTRIKLRHQFTDPKVIDSNLTGVSGTPDCVGLTIKHGFQRVEFSLCTVDIEALASAIGYNLIKRDEQ
jgi:hypothetical protein